MGGGHSTSKNTRVIALHDSGKWKERLENSKKTSKLVVVDFSASWCGPCRKMEPIFNDLAERFTNIEFIKIDVDELKDVAHEFGIDAMPTFVLIRAGKELERLVGANRDKLEKLIDKYRE